MAYFGRSRDIDMFHNVNKELLGQVIEQKVGYYQVILDETPSNMYGENLNKRFTGPVLKYHLQTANVEPSVGDIILWNEDYYEVNNVNENQLVVGKDPDYAYTSENGVPDAGRSLSITLECFYTRPERVGLRENRL